MKRQFSHVNIVNYKFIGAMVGAIGVLLQPLVANAESRNTSEVEEQKQKESANFITSAIKTSKSYSKSNRSIKLLRALDRINGENQAQNVIALKLNQDNEINLPANLQKFVDERDYAAEYILTALKNPESTDRKLPSSLRELVNKRNHIAENTLIALQSNKSTNVRQSLIENIKQKPGNKFTDQENLIALETSELEQIDKNTFEDLPAIFEDEQKQFESKINSTGDYLLALEPFLNNQKPEDSNIGSSVNYTNNYLLALEPFLNQQNPVEFKINSTGDYLLALEPFLNNQKLEDSNIDTSVNYTNNYLLALEPFLNQQNPVEFKINSTGDYLLALEPFLNNQKPEDSNIDDSVNYTNNYLLALEPFLNQKKPVESPINSTGDYLLALEPFLNQQKPVEFKINSTGDYLLALEPFLNNQKPEDSNIDSVVNSTGDYLLALEPFLNQQKPVESKINSTGDYLLALEPFLNNQKPEDSNIDSVVNSTGDYLLALEPFLNQQKPVESPINSTGDYLLALEPFLNNQKPEDSNIDSVVNSTGDYLLALEPFIENQKPVDSITGLEVNSTNNYLLALEPFIDIQKLAESQIPEESLSDNNSNLVAINIFESKPNNQTNQNTQDLIAKNWTPDNIDRKSYNFTSLIAVKPLSIKDNSVDNSSENLLTTGLNSFDSQDNGSQSFNRDNLLSSYSRSSVELPNPENINAKLILNSNQYISQFPQNTNNNAKVRILSPTPEAVVDIAATPIVVQFLVGNQVELRVNGELSDRSLIGRTETDPETDMVRQTWYGVSLQNGENTISAQIIGSKEPPVTVKIMVRGGANQIKVNTIEAKIPADGTSTATIKGTLIDENGNLSNHDTVVTLASTAGEFIGPDFKPGQPGFQVQAKAGQFTATLKSDLDAKTVRIKAKTGKLEAYTQLKFQTVLRPSLMTGVIDLRLGARGTDFYSRFKEFLPEDEDYDTEVKFRSAIFATGAIGEWLVTGAYDSSRPLNEDCDCENRLFRQYQFKEKNYPTYGDSSTVNPITPSIDSVYLRLERSSDVPGANPDYAMWGDYNTQEFARSSQQFTSVTRQLHGFKGNYNFGNLQATAFYGNNIDGFQRDTIAPDGTSGFYFLSRRLAIAGSESVFIELEELNRPGTVVQRERLNRGSDYEIDYDRGTLLFSGPILRTAVGEFGTVLVRRIVVTYQYEGEDDGSTDIYAGRLQYNFSRGQNKDSWLAATYIKEDQGDRDFELYGADAKFSFGKVGRIIAEYARSRNDSTEVGIVEGDAVRAEAEAEFIKGLRTRAYYRFADTGFANDATISFVPGQTRYGVQANGTVTKSTSLRFQYDHENNFGIAPQVLDTFEELFTPRTTATPGNPVDNSLTTISAGIVQKFGKASLSLDYIEREREDRINPQTLNTDSSQLRSRLDVPLGNKLSFVAQNETTLSEDTDAVYSDRTIFGINWKAVKGINISLTQQFFTQGQFDNNSITSLNVNGEHKFGTDTTVTGRFSVLGGSDGPTTQGALGLKQGFTIAPGLRLNMAYERVFGDFFGNNGTGQQFRQPFAVGQSAAALGFESGDSYSVGLEYTDNPNFKASARFERKNSTNGNNSIITAGATGKISPSLTALARYQQAGSSNQGLGALGDTANLKVGLAYRNLKDDKFNALLRYEYRKNPSTIPDTLLFGTGTGAEDHTFAVEAIYAPNWQWEFYGKYALRNSTTYLAQDFTSSSTTNLGQLRATYRLGYSWDLVGEARVITQSDYTETGFVVEAGYYLTPNLRIAAGYSLGEVDDRDFSGSRSGSGPYLGVSMKLNELFSGFGLQKRTPRREIEQRQILLNKLRQGVTSKEEKKNSLKELAERIKGANKSKQPEKTLLQKLRTGTGR